MTSRKTHKQKDLVIIFISAIAFLLLIGEPAAEEYWIANFVLSKAIGIGILLLVHRLRRNEFWE